MNIHIYIYMCVCLCVICMIQLVGIYTIYELHIHMFACFSFSCQMPLPTHLPPHPRLSPIL